MNTTDEQKDSLAALYALGALNETERRDADRQYRLDAEWQPLRTWWQQRLDPLTQLTEAITPSDTVWDKIQLQLDVRAAALDVPDLDLGTPVRDADTQRSRSATGPDLSPIGSSAAQPGSSRSQPGKTGLIEDTVELLRQQARYWQMATMLSVVSIACIAAVLVFKPLPMQHQDSAALPTTVAVLQNEQNVPLWAVSLRKSGQGVDGEYGELLVTVIGEPTITDVQSHQMWMVLKDSQDVQSVGLLPDATGEVRRLVLPRPLSDAAELAVSLEPKGGVPGPEHGPVVTRTFVVSPTVSETF